MNKAIVSAICIAALLLFMNAAPASAQTYYYIGPAFSIEECEALISEGSPPCTSGSITGSVTFQGIPLDYSGTITDIAAYSLSASGVGTMGSMNDLTNSNFQLSNGEITYWQLGAYQGSGLTDKQILSDGVPGGYDVTYKRTSGAFNVYGFKIIPPMGVGIVPNPSASPAPAPALHHAGSRLISVPAICSAKFPIIRPWARIRWPSPDITTAWRTPTPTPPAWGRTGGIITTAICTS